MKLTFVRKSATRPPLPRWAYAVAAGFWVLMLALYVKDAANQGTALAWYHWFFASFSGAYFVICARAFLLQPTFKREYEEARAAAQHDINKEN